MPIERRNLSSVGRKRRRDFDRSVNKLRELGMPDWAVEYYRRVARVSGLPAHMVVCHVAVIIAGQQLTPNVPDPDLGAGLEAPEEPLNGVHAAPASPVVQPLEQGGVHIWRGIQRRASQLSTGFSRVFAAWKREDLNPGDAPPPPLEQDAPVYLRATAADPNGQYKPPRRRSNGLSKTPSRARPGDHLP